MGGACKHNLKTLCPITCDPSQIPAKEPQGKTDIQDTKKLMENTLESRSFNPWGRPSGEGEMLGVT